MVHKFTDKKYFTNSIMQMKQHGGIKLILTYNTINVPEDYKLNIVNDEFLEITANNVLNAIIKLDEIIGAIHD